MALVVLASASNWTKLTSVIEGSFVYLCIFYYLCPCNAHCNNSIHIQVWKLASM